MFRPSSGAEFDKSKDQGSGSDLAARNIPENEGPKLDVIAGFRALQISPLRFVANVRKHIKKCKAHCGGSRFNPPAWNHAMRSVNRGLPLLIPI
jgi:hypothetical protein